MDGEKLPIKFFAHREIDELRVEGGGSKEIPKWVLTGEYLNMHAGRLMNSLDSIEKKNGKADRRGVSCSVCFHSKNRERFYSKIKKKAYI